MTKKQSVLPLTRRTKEGNVVYHLHVGAEDMGRVIGKQGRIAKAIRTIVRAGTNKSGGRATVEID